MSSRATFRVSDAITIAEEVVGYVRENDLDPEEAERFAEMVRDEALRGFEDVAWPRVRADA